MDLFILYLATIGIRSKQMAEVALKPIFVLRMVYFQTYRFPPHSIPLFAMETLLKDFRMHEQG